MKRNYGRRRYKKRSYKKKGVNWGNLAKKAFKTAFVSVFDPSSTTITSILG